MTTADPSSPETEIPADLLDELLALAVETAASAGALALAGRREHREGFDHGQVGDKSSPTDLVTEFDRAAESLIVGRLADERPHDAVIGEEGARMVGTSGFAWLIDPIDGTTNYVYDLPSWCTSVAVTHGRRTVAGAVYVPVTDELFAAATGRGATLNGRPIRCSARHDLSLALVATGFGYDVEHRAAQAERVARMMRSIRDIRRLGSAAIDLCHVGVGRVDAYFEEHLNAWDAAAGELIAREAGAIATDFAGGRPDPAELLVAGPGIHASLLELIGGS